MGLQSRAMFKQFLSKKFIVVFAINVLLATLAVQILGNAAGWLATSRASASFALGDGIPFLQFIAFAVAPARQAELPKYIGYGPASMTAYKSLDAKLAADAPDPKRIEQGSAVVRNDEFWANYGDDLTKRFNVWAAQK